MAVKGTSSQTNSLLDKLKKGYTSKNSSPASSKGKAVKPSYNDPGYTSMAKGVLEDYIKRDEFRYDVNSDKFYSMYADKYKKEGERAMRDTIANAVSLTGGNSNSYAVNAGAQAYTAYLDELNDILPELEARAYERYLDEGDAVSDKIDMLLELDERSYEKYRNSIEDYFADREFYEDNYRYREDSDKEMYQFLSDYLLEIAGLESDSYFKDSELAFAYDQLAYEKTRDAHEQTMAAYDYELALAELALKEQQAKYDANYNKAKLNLEKQKTREELELEYLKYLDGDY